MSIDRLTYKTNTTQIIFLDKQYAQTGLTGSFGSCISGRTATNNN